MTSCSVCGRELTDPASVALGIGPECAMARKEAALQDRNGSLFGEAGASWTYLLDGAILAIEDRGGPGCRSVTNDIERVLTTLVTRDAIDLDACLIIYRDSDGTWDGIATRNGKFARFFPVRQRCYDDARRAVLEYARKRHHG